LPASSRSSLSRFLIAPPLWIVFPALLVLLLISHLTLLRLPYYWDEAGYYIPAAWDLLTTGSLIPHSTLTNAHPPLPSVILVAAWKAFGFSPLVTRITTTIVAALALTGLWRIVHRLTRATSLSLAVVLLTALYPVWFAQETLAHADIFAACGALWGLSFLLPRAGRRPFAALLCFSLAALAKETAIALPMSLAFLFFIEACALRKDRLRNLVDSLILGASAIPLGCWYLYHRHKTGFLFGNPEFLRYNAQANLDAARLLAAFGHRILHLTAHMNLFVLVGAALTSLVFLPREDRHALDRRTRITIAWILFSNALFYSILGGALLTRYLLPLYGLVILLAAHTLWRRMNHWAPIAALAAIAFLQGLFVNPPYGFAPEDNLAYAAMIRLHQEAIAALDQQKLPTTTLPTVLSAWPLSDSLRKPELGYLAHPYTVLPIDDFSQPQIDLALGQKAHFTTALVFSTKYDPPSSIFTLGGRSRTLDTRYFGLHQDLSPEEIARQLGGTVAWSDHQQGLWAALIRFPR